MGLFICLKSNYWNPYEPIPFYSVDQAEGSSVGPWNLIMEPYQYAPRIEYYSYHLTIN